MRSSQTPPFQGGVPMTLILIFAVSKHFFFLLPLTAECGGAYKVRRQPPYTAPCQRKPRQTLFAFRLPGAKSAANAPRVPTFYERRIAVDDWLHGGVSVTVKIMVIVIT